MIDEPGLEPSADAAPVLHLRDEVLDIAVCGSGLLPFHARHLCGTGSGSWRSVHRSRGSLSAGRLVTGYPIELQSEGARSLWHSPSPGSIRSADPTLACPSRPAGRHALHLVGGRHHQLCDVEPASRSMPTMTCRRRDRRRKAAEAKLTTLDDVVRPLHPDDLLITVPPVPSVSPG